MALRFLDYKVQNSTFSLTPDIAPNRNYKITPKISCNLRRAPNRLICSFGVELVHGDEPIPFEFKISAVGTFSIDETDDASALAVKAAETVYPFVRQSVAQLTLMANVPPYLLPMLDMEEVIGGAKKVTLSVPSANLS
ncbi:MAG: protein-export chaperone SecB [Clostridia bacterium]|nr:protein-export chaperone SecB [Clostridia bacterium]